MKYFLMLGLLLGLMGCEYGYTATDQYLLKCLVGESEQKKDMVATAEAMLNRIANMGYDKALRGVYGCKAISEKGGKLYRGSRLIPSWVVRNAERALVEAQTSNLVHGADMWENISAFGEPSWYNCVKTVAIVGNHHFFKEIKPCPK